MASKSQIVNIAIGRIGQNQTVNNVDTETSLVARTARTFWDDDVLYVLRDFPWPWAKAYRDLALVGGSDTVPVNNDWQYSYRYPSDCVYARRLVVESIGRNNPKPPPFSLGRDSQGRLIFTDEAEAQLEYTIAVTDPTEFDSLFVSMLAWKIGAGLAPTLSKIKDMAATCMQMYEIDASKAESRSLNEAQQSEPLEAEVIRARE